MSIVYRFRSQKDLDRFLLFDTHGNVIDGNEPLEGYILFASLVKANRSSRFTTRGENLHDGAYPSPFLRTVGAIKDVVTHLHD